MILYRITAPRNAPVSQGLKKPRDAVFVCARIR